MKKIHQTLLSLLPSQSLSFMKSAGFFSDFGVQKGFYFSDLIMYPLKTANLNFFDFELVGPNDKMFSICKVFEFFTHQGIDKVF